MLTTQMRNFFSDSNSPTNRQRRKSNNSLSQKAELERQMNYMMRIKEMTEIAIQKDYQVSSKQQINQEIIKRQFQTIQNGFKHRSGGKKTINSYINP